MSEYKLHYFNFRAKAELIRLVFAAAGQEYRDLRYKLPNAPDSGLTLEWNSDAKELMPLGQMPVLEVDGQKFCQQSAIARFLAKRFGLMGDDELQAFKVDMVVETMWPDVATKVWKIFYEKDEDKKTEIKEQATKTLPDLLDKIAQWVEGDFVLGAKLSLADLAILDVMSVVNKFLPEFEPPEAIKKVLKNVNENAGIKKWLESRPVSEY